MTKRGKMFNELLLQIKSPNPQKTVLLFHHVYTLKLGDHFVLDTIDDFSGLIQFLNEYEPADGVTAKHTPERVV